MSFFLPPSQWMLLHLQFTFSTPVSRGQALSRKARDRFVPASVNTNVISTEYSGYTDHIHMADKEAPAAKLPAFCSNTIIESVPMEKEIHRLTPPVGGIWTVMPISQAIVMWWEWRLFSIIVVTTGSGLGKIMHFFLRPLIFTPPAKQCVKSGLYRFNASIASGLSLSVCAPVTWSAASISTFSVAVAAVFLFVYLWADPPPPHRSAVLQSQTPFFIMPPLLFHRNRIFVPYTSGWFPQYPPPELCHSNH